MSGRTKFDVLREAVVRLSREHDALSLALLVTNAPVIDSATRLYVEGGRLNSGAHSEHTPVSFNVLALEPQELHKAPNKVMTPAHFGDSSALIMLKPSPA